MTAIRSKEWPEAIKALVEDCTREV
nr:hypothetical protein [Pyrobaculum aerophilum]